ncbi:hypothetical protein GCM10010245_89920 [Streptomyces spectabilis]|uniref:DNA invertase Pin-like site-specific DNA recombinase n=1 Tax=Streptomyces spectabilis TaxID=68270 RepID=A0A7W8B6U0_STRST|nr:DNA invertase Pin-like site-specific DNA recombinase [Streptomyces spectabilis]GGV56900.1 hypothetical protein GCM10010245_89920 [Streptomyces spectabilis]
MTRIFSEKISTRATKRPELEAAVKLSGEIRSSGVAVTLVVHEHKRLGRGIELATLAEELKDSDVGLEFLTGELKGSHDPSGIVFTVLAAMSGMEREYIRDRTLEGHESARKRGKTIGGATVGDEAILSMALRLREQEMSLRDIAQKLVITTGKKKGQHPSPATVMRMLRAHDEHKAAVAVEEVTATSGYASRPGVPRGAVVESLHRHWRPPVVAGIRQPGSARAGCAARRLLAQPPARPYRRQEARSGARASNRLPTVWRPTRHPEHLVPPGHRPPRPGTLPRGRTRGAVLPAMGDRIRTRRDQDPPARSPRHPLQQDPDGVRQQIWAHLLVHHALRTFIVRTAAVQGIDPDRLPFTDTLRAARRSVTTAPGVFSP